jgi:hypothetical protein
MKQLGRSLPAHLDPSHRPQQRKRIGGPALVGAQHSEPDGGGQARGARGELDRLLEHRLRRLQVTGGVPHPAPDGEARRPRLVVRCCGRAVVSEVASDLRAPRVVRGPRARLQRTRAGAERQCLVHVVEGLLVPAAHRPHPRAGDVPVGGRIQCDGFVEELLRGRPVEPRRRSLGRAAQRRCLCRRVTGEACVVRDGQWVSVGTSGEEPRRVSVQHERSRQRGAARQRFAHERMAEPVVLRVQHHDSPRHRGVENSQQADGGRAGHCGQQFDVDRVAHDRRGSYDFGVRAEPIDDGVHRVYQCLRQRRISRGSELGEEERVAAAPIEEALREICADQLRGVQHVERAEREHPIRSDGCSGPRAPGDDDAQRTEPVGQPVDQRDRGRVREMDVVDREHHR